MHQEADDRATVHGIAVQALKNELELAAQVLRGVKQGKGATPGEEAHAVESARAAFRHAVDALDRVPQLSSEDMETVQRLMDEFRSALAELQA
jgi:hypothetical protein